MGGTVEKRRRWLGVFFLLAALAMLLAGQTVLRGRLSNLGFVLYWLVCFGFTLLAMVVAWMDALAIRRDSRVEQRAFVEETLREIARKRNAAAGTATKPDPGGSGQKLPE